MFRTMESDQLLRDGAGASSFCYNKMLKMSHPVVYHFINTSVKRKR